MIHVRCFGLAVATLVILASGWQDIGAQTLKGEIEENDSGRRAQTANDLNDSPIDLDALKDPVPQQIRRLEPQIDQHDFLNLPASTFDIGIDRNCRELVLAWEQWHKQLSHSIYVRTGQRTLGVFGSVTGMGVSGSAAAIIHVTRDQRISAEIVAASGSPLIRQAYLGAIYSLNGNPGLTFPTGSQRNEVTFRYQFIQAENIRGGYDWKHGDVERVQEDY